jgi:hypothetical protein
MFLAVSSPQAVESMRTVIVMSAIGVVVFWKMLFKIIVMGAVIMLIILLTSGAVVLLASIHHAAI